MIKAIFFDIDGTLVSFNTHKIPQSTIDSLKQLKTKGIKLFIATGRPPYDLKMLIEKNHLGDIFDGYITFNGQYCYEQSGNLIHEEYLHPEDLKQLTNYIEGKDIACGCMEIDYLYFNLFNDSVKKLNETLGDTAPKRAIDDMNRVFTHKTYQITIFLSEENEQIIAPILPHCRLVRWCPLFADIIPQNGGKGNSIKKILAHYNIAIDETMAFGDGGNDKEMLETVGHGIAMGNANDELKSIADFVTLDVDNDGIFYALKKYNLL